MIGPYEHLHEIDSHADCNSRRPFKLRFDDNVRRLRKRLYESELIRTAYDELHDWIVFFRTPNHDGHPVIYFSVPVRDVSGNTIYGKDIGDYVMSIICSGKRSWRAKMEKQDMIERSKKNDGDEKFEKELADSGKHLYDVACRQDEYEGMGRHFQKSHLIENNPLHS